MIFAPKENSKGDTMGEPVRKNTEAPPETVLACQQLADGLVDELIILSKTKDIDNVKMYGCITTLHLFAKARPELLIRHASIIEPYLINQKQTATAQKFLCCVADILEKVVPLVTNPSESFLAQLEEHLMFLVISSNQAVVSSCISCLSALVNKITKNYKLIRDCFVRFYKQMVKSKEHVQSNPAIAIDNIYTPIFRRSLFTIGIIMRYFDFKSRKVLGIDEGDTTISPNVSDEVFHLLMYFSTCDRLDIRKQALVALGQFCVQNDEYLTRTELKEFYCDLLKNTDKAEPFMKTSVMRNIWLYLTESENLMFNKEKDWEKQAKTENLKEMNDVTSGMASRIIQLYLEEILACFLHQDYSVRLWAVKVVAIVLRQGLVAPQRMVPWLIALSTDEKQETAHRADALLKEIDKTYVGYINQKIQSGLQTSFKLQKVIKGETAIVRGYMKRDPNSVVPTSLNDFVYTLLRTTKPQRRAFIHTVTKQFDDLKTTLKQMLYLADNLAYFPYVVQDEPLYLIHQIDLMISVTGTNLLQTFKEGLKPPEGERDILEDDDDEDDADVLVQRLPDETKELEKCITSAQGCMLLLVLKQHLKDMYGLTDGKISRYSPSETQKIYEKNITRKQVPEFNPKTTIDIIKKDASALSQLDSAGKKDLVVNYLDFKQLMLKLDPDEEDSATEDLNKSKLNNTSTFNSDGIDQPNDSSLNLNNSSGLENSTQEAVVDQTDCSVNKVNYNKSNKDVQGTPLTKSSKSTPSKPPPRRQPARSKRKKRKMISSDDDEDDDDEEDDDDYDGFS